MIGIVPRPASAQNGCPFKKYKSRVAWTLRGTNRKQRMAREEKKLSPACNVKCYFRNHIWPHRMEYVWLFFSWIVKKLHTNGDGQMVGKMVYWVYEICSMFDLYLCLAFAANFKKTTACWMHTRTYIRFIYIFWCFS